MTDEFHFDDLSLEFLQTTPPKKLNGGRETIMQLPTPLRALEFSEKTVTPASTRSRNRQKSQHERAKLAQRIAEADVLVGRYRKLEQEHRELKESAQAIHTMYETERQNRMEYEKKWQQIQERNSTLDEELANVRLQRDQLEAQLAEREGPIQYSKLAVQFVRQGQRLNDERMLHWQDQATLKKMIQYCEEQKLHVPQPRSPKKRKAKAEKGIQCVVWDRDPRPVQIPKIKVTAEQSTQCDRLVTCDQSTQHTTPLTISHPPVKQPPAKETRHQSTQYDCIGTRSQGTQHIGTTTTRGTSTTCFIKQHHVGTSFPERTALPTFTDMLHELHKWQRIKPISPIVDPPPTKPTTCYRTVGTCTFLCNIQRQIDIIPAPLTNTAVKRSNSRPPSRLACESNIKCETSILSPPIIPSQNCAPTPSLIGNLHQPTFDEMWQVFGKMIYGLLQHRSEPNVVASPLPAENPPELQNLMRSIYDNMQQKKPRGVHQSPQHGFVPSSNIISGKESVTEFFQPLSSKCQNFSDCDGINSVPASNEDSTTRHNMATSPIHFNSTPVQRRDVAAPEALHTFLKPKPNNTEIAYKVRLKSPIKMSGMSSPIEHCIMPNHINFIRAGKVKMDKMQKKCKKKRLNTSKKLKNLNTASSLQIKETPVEENVITNEKQLENENIENPSLTVNAKCIQEIDLFGNDSDLEDIPVENQKGEEKDNEQNRHEDSPPQIPSPIAMDDKISGIQANLKRKDKEGQEHVTIEDSPANIDEDLILNDDDDEMQLIIDDGMEDLQHVNSPRVIQSTNDEEQKNTEDYIATPPVSRDFVKPIVNELILDTPINPFINTSIEQTSQRQHKRGRKRKNEMNRLEPCKRSERLRARQLIASNPSSCNISSNDTELNKTIMLTQRINCGQEEPQDSAGINSDGEEHNEEVMNLFYSQQSSTTENIQQQPLKTQSDTTNELTANNCDSATSEQQENDKFDCFMQEHRKVINKDMPLPINENPLPSIKMISFANNQQHYDESPASPTPCATDDEVNEQKDTKEIPLELRVHRQSECHALLDRIAEYYCNTAPTANSKRKVDAHQQRTLETQMSAHLRHYLESPTVNPDVEAHTLTMSLLEISSDGTSVASVIVNCARHIPRPEVELACAVSDVPSNYIAVQLKRIGLVLHQLCTQHPQGECYQRQLLLKIETFLFNCECADKLSLDEALNFTQLYLLVISEGNYLHTQNPARLFIGKCLYYHQLKAIPMIYEVLCFYPTVLPHREERSYDRSDALITVLQHALMCTNYDMDKRQLRTRELLSMLRFVYHYEPFRPNQAEVLQNLLDKLRAGRLTNIAYAMAIYCKRLPPAKVASEIVHLCLLPMANEFYPLLLQSDAHDERVSALLECISIVVKPFPLQTDVSVYLAFFARFLNVVERIKVQEAAVQAILRLQRFGYANCYQALQNFKPNSDLTQLQPDTQAMLKTFVLRKPLSFWRALRQQ